MFKLDLEKAEEPEIKLPTSAGSLKKQESSRKNIYFCFIDYAKAFDCVDHNKLWKYLKEMGIPDHLTCLLRNLYAGQEATVRLIFFPTHHFSLPENPSIVYSLFMCCLFPLEVKLHENRESCHLGGTVLFPVPRKATNI